MAGARFLTASRIAGNAEARDSHTPRMNYKPAFESIIRSGDLSAAPEKLANAMKSLMASAATKGVEPELNSILKSYASEIGNDIVLLTLRRLERLVDSTPKGQLKERLETCSILMKEFQGAADAIPALLTGNDRITSSGALGIDSMRKVLRRGISKSRSLCPKEISSAIKAELDSGRMDDIKGVAEIRGEQARTGPAPAIASQPAIPLPATAQQQASDKPALKMPSEQRAESRPDALARTQNLFPLSPLQMWEEVRKLREGKSRGIRRQSSPEQSRDELADKRAKPSPPKTVPKISPPENHPKQVLGARIQQPITTAKGHTHSGSGAPEITTPIKKEKAASPSISTGIQKEGPAALPQRNPSPSEQKKSPADDGKASPSKKPGSRPIATSKGKRKPRSSQSRAAKKQGPEAARTSKRSKARKSLVKPEQKRKGSRKKPMLNKPAKRKPSAKPKAKGKPGEKTKRARKLKGAKERRQKKAMVKSAKTRPEGKALSKRMTPRKKRAANPRDGAKKKPQSKRTRARSRPRKRASPQPEAFPAKKKARRRRRQNTF